MYMRYYPREIKPINRMEVLMPDKGKKHYWGYDKGDYGVYTTEDQEYLRNMNSLHRLNHARSRTVEAAAMNKYEIINPESILQKSVTKFADPSQIRLPSISRVSRETQTEFNPQKKSNAGMEAEQKQRQKQEKRMRSQRSDNYQRRYHTEQIQQNRSEIKFEPGTRFSPTFVCSVLNPLPSYIIQPHHYRSRDYTRVQTQRQRAGSRRY